MAYTQNFAVSSNRFYCRYVLPLSAGIASKLVPWIDTVARLHSCSDIACASILRAKGQCIVWIYSNSAVDAQMSEGGCRSRSTPSPHSKGSSCSVGALPLCPCLTDWNLQANSYAKHRELSWWTNTIMGRPTGRRRPRSTDAWVQLFSWTRDIRWPSRERGSRFSRQNATNTRYRTISGWFVLRTNQSQAYALQKGCRR